MALAIFLAGTLSSGCLDFAKGLQRAKYDYRAARRVCHATRVDRQVCMDTVDEAYKHGADPATYVPEHERQRAEQQRREEEDRQQRILARCSSAPELIRASFAKRACAQAYKIAEESEGVCPESARVSSALMAEIRKMSPQDVAMCRSEDIARLYWRPIEIWDWFAAASGGKLISEQGVYIPGTIEQQFEGHAMVEVSETIRVVVRLDRQRLFQIGQPVYAIGRFVEIGHFTTALGARVDMPIFDLVYLP